MNNFVSSTVLKGGSLNKTSLYRLSDGSQFVRKSIARRENREYGFVRWYSQFKRLQRLGTLFPNLFPIIFAVGSDEESAWFDMEYIDNSLDIKTYLTQDNLTLPEIMAVHQNLWNTIDVLHKHSTFPTWPGSLPLYYQEEVTLRLKDASTDERFKAFSENAEIILNGRPVQNLMRNLDWYEEAFGKAKVSRECFTHGNLTLENVLYVETSGRVVFVDPYEENVLDCPESEYSQILQCSNQNYGYINDRHVIVEGNCLAFREAIAAGLVEFNRLFLRELGSRLSDEEYFLVRLFEASQFTRMLPFKLLSGQHDKAMYFFGVASRLVEDLRRENVG